MGAGWASGEVIGRGTAKVNLLWKPRPLPANCPWRKGGTEKGREKERERKERGEREGSK